MSLPSVLKSRLLHLLFPQTCCHCREDLPRDHPAALCRACVGRLSRAEPPLCRRCGDRVAPTRAYCVSCCQRPFFCAFIRSAVFYRGPAASLVHAFKFRYRRDAAAEAGKHMAAALERLPELGAVDCLVPVPLHSSRERRRGYNQALLLAQEVARARGAPIEEPLVRLRAASPQHRLARLGRRANVVGLFRARALLASKRVLLIDDVCTTAATLEACARALRLAGAASVNALVFARQPRGG